MKTALFIGRFQPFHKAHLEDIKKILKEVDKIIIAIGSSQESDTYYNPFTVEERIEMIEITLAEENISNYTIFPVPDLGNDKKWVEHVKTLVPKFDIVYTSSDLTEKLFKEAGYKVKKLKFVKGISATIIRDRMINGENWRELLPDKVVEFLIKINGIERVKSIKNH